MITNKLISIRVDENVLAKIDEMAKTQNYLTRSFIINRVLEAAITCSTPGSLSKIVNTFCPYDKGYVLKFDYDKEVAKDRRDRLRIE